MKASTELSVAACSGALVDEQPGLGGSDGDYGDVRLVASGLPNLVEAPLRRLLVGVAVDEQQAAGPKPLPASGLAERARCPEP